VKAGWEVRPLGEFAELITKGTTPTSVGHSFAETGINFIKVESITERGDFLPHKFAFISDDVHQDLRRSQLKEGDVLFSIAGALGRTAIVTADVVPANTNQALSLIRLKDDAPIDRAFLVYSLGSASILEQIEKLRIGAAQQNLSLAQVREFPIPLPPLEEQERIVAILDEAFEGLARARTHAETNLQNARELFERQLAAYFIESKSSWTRKKLSQVTTKVGSGATPTGGSAAYKTDGISLIRSLNVHDRWFKSKELAFIDDEQADKLSNVVVNERDVLLNITGASVARCCVAPTEFLPARVNQHVSIVRPIHSVLLPEFLAFMLTSQPYKDGLLKTGEDNGSTRQALTKALILELEVSFPSSVAEQEEAVELLSIAEAKSKQLEEHYRKKLQSLDALRQSLLQKAFAGELT
jgi:type I restriction enzyme S subunit